LQLGKHVNNITDMQ